jgi:hypothetical protein
MKKLSQQSRVFFLSLFFFVFHAAIAQQTCNGSLLFDKTNDIGVILPSTNQYYTATNGGYTWECWIMLNSAPGSTNDDRPIISSLDWTIYEDMYLGFGWHGGVQNRGYDSLVFKVDGPSSAFPADPNCAWAPAGGFNTGQWYHVAGVADYNAGKKYLYVDCQLVDSQVMTVATNTRVMPTHLSACSTCSGANSLDGYMDEVRIWTKPLDQNTISGFCRECLTGTEPNLFLYYRCNQAGATQVLDATTNFNNGSFINPPATGWAALNAPVSGKACKEACICLGSLDFDINNNPSVSLPLSNQYYTAINDGYTWETWFKLASAPGSTNIDRPLISATDWTIFEDMYFGFGWHGGVQNRGYDSLVFKVDGPLSAFPTDINCAWAPAGGFVAGQWYHAAGVANYTAGMKYLYVDGVLVDSQLMTVATNTRSIPTNLSSCAPCSDVNSLDGKMDEVRIWDTPLTTTDILNNYQKCRTGTETNLLVYYRCNQVGAGSVYDGTGNGFTGTFVNSPGWSTENAPVTGTCHKDCNKDDEDTDGPAKKKTVGLEKRNSPDAGLRIYPNPSSGSLRISSEQPGLLSIYSVTGQLLSELKVQKDEREIKLEGYKAGIYLYVFSSESHTTSGKLIIE